MPVRVIATGGTFDKHYDPLGGQLGFDESALPGLLAQARLVPPPVLEVLMQIDSLDMDAGHRARILAACRTSPEPAIVVVHGTDTMTQTAEVLGAAALPGKTIVLTGAMVPARVAGSDAAFNLGAAIAYAQALPAGVHVAMNGVAHRWDAVRKDRAQGVFVATR